MIRLILLIGILGLGGCATVEGMGRDISAGARKVSDAL